MIRPATIDDIFTVMEMSQQMKQESPEYRDSSYVAEKHFTWLVSLLDNEDRIFVVNEEDGEITGFFMGGLSTYFFNYEQFAEDYTLYVAPEHRGGRTGMRLVKAFEQWARERGVKTCFIGTALGIQPGRFVGFLEALGYSGPGVTLSKRVQ